MDSGRVPRLQTVLSEGANPNSIPTGIGNGPPVSFHEFPLKIPWVVAEGEGRLTVDSEYMGWDPNLVWGLHGSVYQHPAIIEHSGVGGIQQRGGCMDDVPIKGKDRVPPPREDVEGIPPQDLKVADAVVLPRTLPLSSDGAEEFA